MKNSCIRYSSFKMPSSVLATGSDPIASTEEIKVFHSLDELQDLVSKGFFVFVFGNSLYSNSSGLSGTLILEGAGTPDDLRDYIFLNDILIDDLTIEYVSNGYYPRSIRFLGTLLVKNQYAELERGVFSYYKAIKGEGNTPVLLADPCSIEYIEDLEVNPLSVIQLIGSYYNCTGIDFNIIQSPLKTNIAPIDTNDPTKFGLITYDQLSNASNLNFTSAVSYGTDNSLTVNKIINPPSGEGSFGTPNDMGNFLPINGIIVGIQFGITRFITNGLGYIDFDIRYIVADGSEVGAINGNSGTLLDTVRLDLPNTLGSEKNYMRGGKTYDIPLVVPNDAMVFIVVSGRLVQSVTGVVINLGVEIV